MAHIDTRIRDESDGVAIGQSNTAREMSMTYESFDSDTAGNDHRIELFATITLRINYTFVSRP